MTRSCLPRPTKWAALALMLALTAACGDDATTPTGPNGDDLPAPQPDGVLLEGEAPDPAVDATRLLPPSPVPREEIDGTRLTTRLTAFLDPEATVAQVNAALEAEDVRIVTMLEGAPVVSLRTAPMISETDARALAARLADTEAFLFVQLALENRPQPVVAEGLDRVLPDSGLDRLEHLEASSFPAAWNLTRLARQRSNRVTVLVPDLYLSSTPLDAIRAQRFLEIGIEAAPRADEAEMHDGNHGFHVAGIVGANFDGDHPTGTSPDPTQLLDIRSMHAAGMSSVDWMVQLRIGFPTSGPFVMSTSLGTGGNAALTKQDLLDLFGTAMMWRIAVAGDRDRFVHLTAAGNEARTGGLRAQASYGSTYTAAARFDDLTTLIPADSLTTAEAEAIDHIWATTVAANPGLDRKLDNTVIVGSSNFAGGESEFSNLNADVRALGESVVGPCALADPALSTNADLCDGSIAKYSGTSMATPLVAGLAAYLWNLDSSLTPADIVDKLKSAYGASRVPGIVDAYLAVLSLDASFSDAPIRRSLLDVAGATIESGPNGRFDEVDIEAFLFWLRQYPIQNAENVVPVDHSRYDLNGDGQTDPRTEYPFDLNFNGQTIETLTLDTCTTGESFDESILTDADVLRYYAFSPLYQGDAAARDALLCEGPRIEVTGLPERMEPGDTATVVARLVQGNGASASPLADVDIQLRFRHGVPFSVSGTTNTDGRFIATVTMRDEDEFSYFNELEATAFATVDDRQIEGRDVAIRPNAIVLRARNVLLEADVDFQYRTSNAAGGSHIVYMERGEFAQGYGMSTEPVTENITWNESGSGSGMSARSEISQSVTSTITGTASAFGGASFLGTTAGFASLSDPDFDVLSYFVSVNGRAEVNVAFSVYGDPATFNVSGTITGARAWYAWIFGPNDPYSCEYDECSAIGGSGQLQPGRYSFVGVQTDVGRLTWCEGCDSWPNSGTSEANGSVSIDFTVSH